MPIRNFINIDEEKCNGCGECIIACTEGALAIVNGKARVVGENLCDGLGACIGHCPLDALEIVSKDVADFDEHAVEKHLLKDHHSPCCPSMSFHGKITSNTMAKNTCDKPLPSASMLAQWPIQLALVNPQADYFKHKKLLLAADCSAFSYGAFHQNILAGCAIVIACPKLDHDTEFYRQKLATIIKHAETRQLEVVRMEVACCGGLLHIAREAARAAGVICEVKETVIGIQGDLR
ncbi:MAG: 4Fe-4S binding protein [Deltaproteobacteria bacterium]|nr:4Fe-4S binding protein [Deltaproteobacteria bacterium]